MHVAEAVVTRIQTRGIFLPHLRDSESGGLTGPDPSQLKSLNIKIH
jgi:hypothetical protein